jgi:NADPH-dependent glutamate synthase beta subunit-like oxidoreductase/CO/xanthine dehydrogenase FAD-binding subunit
MTIPRIDHASARSLEQAAELATQAGKKTAFVAGGTDLLGVLKDCVHPARHDLLIDLKPIQGLSGVKADGGLEVGALTTLTEVARHGLIKAGWPLLAQAARVVASPQIRNMGTLGGNLCQEPRCWYYRTPENLFHCMRKGGDMCGAVLGDNRYHSVLGAARVCQPGCAFNCPAHVAIPQYMELIRRGDLEQAARLILASNPMPAITGRVCPHPCQSRCTRRDLDQSVSTRGVERHLGDYLLANAATILTPPASASGRRVAIVGAGPAGLSAAYYLRRAGHAVTVFDKLEQAGGMLRYCIPAYRLPKEVLDRQVAAYEAMGITFVQGVGLGDGGPTLDELRRDHDALFLATGGWKQKTLNLADGDQLSSGLDFLGEVARGRRQAPGRKVLVIGGGSVAVDVAITARRLGAEQVTMACLEAREIMPAIPEDIDQAVEEHVDLLPAWGPHRVIVREGRLAGLELVRCTSVFDREGRFKPSFDFSTTRTVEADCVLVAIGQGPDLSWANGALVTERGCLKADQETQQTSLPGVFAGGDLVTGASTVVAALAAGRRAASAIDRHLGGTGELSEAGQAAGPGPGQGGPIEVNTPALKMAPASRPAWRPLEQRSIQAEDVATMDLHAVETEANRCINCGCVAVNASDLAPALVALEAIINTTRRAIPAERFFAVGQASTTTLEPGEVVTGIAVPAQPVGSVQFYQKFRIRNSIDFPIVGLATVLEVREGVFARARAVLGAVGPVPHRLDQVERFLIGRKPDEDTAEGAAVIAVRGMAPLARNGFKLQIVKALVRKAVLGAG